MIASDEQARGTRPSSLLTEGGGAWVIAEIGINHEGDATLCAEMIAAAVESGADAIKLQTVDADQSYAKGTESHKLFKRASLSRRETEEMFSLTRKLGAEPLTTVGDLETLSWVDQFDPIAYKVSSGLLTAAPLIEQLATTGKPLILSTGMSLGTDVSDAVDDALRAGARDLVIMHCISVYPAPLHLLQLSTIPVLMRQYDFPIGYSDHSIGTAAAPVAVALGAKVIEKHITLDSTRESFDHRLSVEPQEFASMVRAIRQAEDAIGTPRQCLSAEEMASRQMFRRCLVASREIGRHECFSTENVGIMRPRNGQTGLPPRALTDVIGKTASVAIQAHESIMSHHVQR